MQAPPGASAACTSDHVVPLTQLETEHITVAGWPGKSLSVCNGQGESLYYYCIRQVLGVEFYRREDTCQIF